MEFLSIGIPQELCHSPGLQPFFGNSHTTPAESFSNLLAFPARENDDAVLHLCSEKSRLRVALVLVVQIVQHKAQIAGFLDRWMAGLLRLQVLSGYEAKRATELPASQIRLIE